MKKKAQSILEYVVVLGVVGIALAGMQLYYRRVIQQTIKIAADEIGNQRVGATEVDYSYEWKFKGQSNVASDTTSTETITKTKGGAVTYDKNATTSRSGILSWGWWTEK